MEGLNSFESSPGEPEKREAGEAEKPEPPRFKVFEAVESVPRRGSQAETRPEPQAFADFPVTNAYEDRNPDRRAEALEAAQEDIISNSGLYKEVLAGARGRHGHYAFAQNYIIQHCLDLSDEEIRGVLRRFGAELREWFKRQDGDFDEDVRSAINRHYPIEPEGILPVVHYLRGRKRHIDSKDGIEASFGYNNYLDTSMSIDVVEFLRSRDEEGNETIEEMNLVQIKNSAPSTEEIAEIVSDHRIWATERVLSFEELKELQKRAAENPESREFERIMEDKEELYMRLIDIITGSEEFYPDTLIDKLELRNVSNLARTLLLLEHFKDFIEQAESVERDAGGDDSWSRKLRESYVHLTEVALAKSGIPHDAIPIARISSIVATGSKIVSKVALYENADRSKIGKFAAPR